MNPENRGKSHRRRIQVAMAWENLHREASRIAESQQVEHHEAVMVVFSDPELLAACHRVPGAPWISSALPISDIEAQNARS
jgi:hypothetical protein